MWLLGFGGSKLWAPRVLLVMTHADVTPSSVTSSRDKELYEELMQQHAMEVILEPHIFRLDANQAMGAEMKLLRQTLASIKKNIVEVSPSISLQIYKTMCLEYGQYHSTRTVVQPSDYEQLTDDQRHRYIYIYI